ncbi:MAG: hypothetical protein GY885_18275 [Phycisphaeraceae bacterium]|nr:hypothetical protein [Phycisphaeraceae bacterium]
MFEDATPPLSKSTQSNSTPNREVRKWDGGMENAIHAAPGLVAIESEVCDTMAVDQRVSQPVVREIEVCYQAPQRSRAAFWCDAAGVKKYPRPKPGAEGGKRAD